MSEPIDLTPDQREVLTRRYNEWRQKRAELSQAAQSLEDVCRVLAGEGYTLDPEGGRLELLRATGETEGGE